MNLRRSDPNNLLKDTLIPEVQVSHITNIEVSDPVNLPHRDADYMLLFQRMGYLDLMVDNEMIEMKGPSIYFILPGQLYHHVRSKTETWVLAVNASFLQESLRLKLNEHYYGKNAVALSKKKAERFTQCMQFLYEEKHHPVYKFSGITINKGLIDVISGMTAEEYAIATSVRQGEHSRFSVITREFKDLLLNNFKKMKKPAAYADALSLSTPYLNQVIKATTGFTVSYWIQKMVMNEARILLSSTLNPIKDIAYELGYTDQAYFSRLFSRTQKISPQQYRLNKQA